MTFQYMDLQFRKSIEYGLFVWMLMLLCFCNSEKAPYYTFVQEATWAPRVVWYDYIIIGGGTSGCPLAATLSKTARVLVLERGGSPYENRNITEIGNFVDSLTDTSPDSPSQIFISEDGVYNTRARVLGGGSALNAGFYSHAGAEYIKRMGWSEMDVKKAYKWVEKKVAFKPKILKWQQAVKNGLIEAGVLPYNGFTYGQNYGTKIGGTSFDKYGQRHTAADLLEYAYPTNIDVYLHATVTKILFTSRGTLWSRPRAYGVTYVDAMGREHTALLNRDHNNEIIVAAGAIGSPQLLMLSGIGPSRHLNALKIPIVLNQPMVGQGMSDNPMNLLFVPSPLPVELSLIQVAGITRFGNVIESASGFPYSISWATRFIREYEQSSNQTGQPNMLTPQAMARAVKRVKHLVNAKLRGGVILEKVVGPRSTGYLKLRTNNVNDNPSVKFNYFKEPEDLKKCVKGMKTVINVIKSRAFRKFRYKYMSVKALLRLMANLPVNLRPRHVRSASSLEQFCRDTVMTIWHYHGGCHVGKVVDNQYRVIGIDGLRVIDGSTFVHTPGTNPQATVMMLGRYMGKKIQHERLYKRRKYIKRTKS